MATMKNTKKSKTATKRTIKAVPLAKRKRSAKCDVPPLSVNTVAKELKQKISPKAPPAAGVKKVWQIVKHAQRMQQTYSGTLPDGAILSSPYIQFPVRPKDPEIILFQQQLDSLLTDPKTRAAWTCFWLLARWSFDAEVRFRGLLLDWQRSPATNAFLAERVGMKPVELKKALAVLERAGLMEYVPFEDPGNKPQPKSRRAGWRKEQENKKKGSKKSDEKKGEKRGARSVPGGARHEVARFQERETGNGNGKSKRFPSGSGKSGNRKSKNKTGTGNGKATAAPSQEPEPERQAKPQTYRLHNVEGGITEVEIPNPNPKGQAQPQAEAVNEASAAKRCSPATTPPDPIVPTVPDADKACHTRPHATQDALYRLYDPEAKDFARAVYTALWPHHGLRIQPDELGNYAAAWQDAQAAHLPPSQLQLLWDKSVGEAWKLGKKPESAFTKGRGAVWRSIFERRLNNLRPKAAAI